MRRRRRKKGAGFLVPTTSMGDIAFLLIIFFILCSTKKTVTVAPPIARDLENLPKPTIIVSIDKDSRIYLNGEQVGSAGSIESGIAERLAKVDANAPADERTVIFECDREVEKEVFEPVLEAMAKGGAIIGAVGAERKADNE